jgi:hypothetical protein
MTRGARWLPLVPLAGLVCAITKGTWPVGFTHIAAKAGLIAANVSGDITNKKYILEMNGSGVAFLDYNRDGFVDLFVVNGAQLEPRAGTADRVGELQTHPSHARLAAFRWR